MLTKAEEKINTIRCDDSLNTIDKIINVLLSIFTLLEQNRQLLSVIMDYLLHLSKNNTNPEERVRRRTVILRHILSSMVIEGIKSGELTKVNIKTADDYLYSFIESAVSQLVVLKREDLCELKDVIVYAVKQFAV
jgi:hypothetical protein